MPIEPRVWRGKASETGTKFFRSRITDIDGNVVTQADLTGTIHIKVYDLSSTDADTVIYSNASITISSAVFNTLQTWDIDSVGYNLETSVTSNNVSGWEGGHTYRAEVYYTHTADGAKAEIYEALIEPQLGS